MFPFVSYPVLSASRASATNLRGQSENTPVVGPRRCWWARALWSRILIRSRFDWQLRHPVKECAMKWIEQRKKAKKQPKEGKAGLWELAGRVRWPSGRWSNKTLFASLCLFVRSLRVFGSSRTPSLSRHRFLCGWLRVEPQYASCPDLPYFFVRQDFLLPTAVQKRIKKQSKPRVHDRFGSWEMPQSTHRW